MATKTKEVVIKTTEGVTKITGVDIKTDGVIKTVAAIRTIETTETTEATKKLELTKITGAIKTIEVIIKITEEAITTVAVGRAIEVPLNPSRTQLATEGRTRIVGAPIRTTEALKTITKTLLLTIRLATSTVTTETRPFTKRGITSKTLGSTIKKPKVIRKIEREMLDEVDSTLAVDLTVEAVVGVEEGALTSRFFVLCLFRSSVSCC